MNILITAPSLDELENVSGISSVVKAIIQHRPASNRYVHFRIGKPDNQKRGIRWIYDQFMLLPRFCYYVLKYRIQVVHLNTALTAKSIFRDLQIILFTKLIRKKIILHIHGGVFLMNPPKRNSVMHFLILRMLRNADLRIVLSEGEKEVIRNNYGSECLVLPNAIETFADHKEKSFSGVLHFIFIGRITESKGVFLIGEAMKELREEYQKFILHIYGFGPDLEPLLAQLKECPGLQFQYHGVTRGDDKLKAFENAHLFLLPSLYGEGLPMAMLEAMSSGCIPIVSTDGSMASVVRNGDNGYLVQKGSKEEFKKTIRTVLYDREHLVEMSQSALKTIKKHHNISTYMQALSATYP